MRCHGWTLATLVAAVVIPSFPTYADAPKVASARPDKGDTRVDPATREVRVVFDQAMDQGGFSFVGGGETFPQLAGRPRWIDERTCVLPVRLRPDHDYWLSINSERFTNFKNQNGESAIPYPIRFRTRAAEGGVSPSKPQENREALAELRRAIDQDYSYRDLRGVNWDSEFQKASSQLIAARSPEEFAERTAALLAPAKDLHLWLQVGDSHVATSSRRVTPNFSLPSLQKAVPGWARKSPTVFAGQFGDGIGYVMITTWAKDRAKELQAAFDVLEDPQCSKGLIIDVRPNSGGDELLARAFAGCFVAEPRVYAKHTVRDGGKFSSIGARTVGPNPDHPRYQGKVAVLMGRANMSSCESFLLMMKQAENCTLVGERSYGSSGNPQPVTLGNGITLYVPSWKDLRPDGTCFEGEGLAPDLEVKAEAREFESGDPVLEAALVLRRRP